MPKKLIEKSEYIIKAKDHQGEVFVPHAFQSDVTSAVQHYNNVKNSIETRTKKLKVWIEKHIVTRKVTDFTEDAEKMLKNGNA